MSKEERILNYYMLCNKLKDIVRSGWKVWNIKRERVESIAEHIYGVQMLAIAMKSEYQYDISLEKVILMLAIHELGETVIGDLTQFEIDSKSKEIIEHKAVHTILHGLIEGEKLEELFLEFDAKETKEAIFAYQCDKLECDLQSKLYDEEKCVDLNNQPNNEVINNKRVKELLNNGESFSEMWLKFGQETYPYDENFRSVSNSSFPSSLYVLSAFFLIFWIGFRILPWLIYSLFKFFFNS